MILFGDVEIPKWHVNAMAMSLIDAFRLRHPIMLKSHAQEGSAFCSLCTYYWFEYDSIELQFLLFVKFLSVTLHLVFIFSFILIGWYFSILSPLIF